MINMTEWMREVLEDPKRRVIPIMTHPGIELIHETVRRAVCDGQVHFEAIRELNESYPADACTAIMDLTVEAEAFGAEIVFPEHEVPSVTKRLVSDYASVQALEVPGLDKGRVQEYLKANRLTAAAIPSKPVFAGCIGPYSLAGRLYDMTELMMAAYTEPDTAVLLLEKCTEFLIRYCRAIKATGVNGVIMAEPAAGLLSNEDCALYSSRYVKQIVEQVQDDSFMIVLHNCGNTGHCTGAMLETGAKGYHFGEKADILEALQQCPSDVLVMGNLSPVELFKMSTPEQLGKATQEMLDATSSFRNYVLSSGCDVPPGVSSESIEAFYKAIEIYNQKL